MASVTLEQKITSYNYVTSQNLSLDWTYANKVETDYLVNSSDGAQTINLTTVANPTLISFYSDSSFTVSITAGGSTIAFGVENFFQLNPTTTFMSTVTAITVTSLQSSDALISVRIYGD